MCVFQFVPVSLGKTEFIYPTQAMGHFAVVRQLVYEKGKTEFKPARLQLKINVVSHSTWSGGARKIYSTLRIYHHHYQIGFPWLSLYLSIYLSLPLSLFQSPSAPIIQHSWQVFKTTSCVRAKLLKVSSCWSATTDTSSCRVPWENGTYEFVLASSAVSRMSCSSYLDGFKDGS